MNIANRSYLTAGIAALGASAVALAPIQPVEANVALAHQPVVANLAVNLASTIDPITPWVTTLQTAVANLQQLGAFYQEQPLPLIQTIGANIQTYIQEISNGNAAVVPQQIADNARKFFEAPWWNKTDSPILNDQTFANEFISDTTIGTAKSGPVTVLKLSQKSLFGLLPLALTPDQVTQLQPILEFAATPYGGQLAGFVAPFIGSVAQLTKSFTAVGQFFQNGDLVGAINELINIPANMTNAFLNGYGNFDLTSIAAGLLPPEIQKIGLNLGGWISPPVPKNGSLIPTVVTPTKFGIGTFFDAVSVTAGVSGLTAESPGLPTSAAGANIGLGQFLANALLVTPVTSTAAVKPTASVRAAAAVEAPEIEVPKAVEAPAAPEVSAPALEKKAASSDNGGKSDGPSRGGHKGARGD